MNRHPVTWRAALIGLLAAMGIAVLSVLGSNFQQITLASCQIPVLPYLILIGMVLLINPLLRLTRVIRVFSGLELLVVFLMGSVSAGIANFGLVEQVVPLAGSLFYGDWNNPQSEWSRHIAPFVNEAYFVSEPGLQEAARAYHGSYGDLLRAQSVLDTAGRARAARARAAEADAEIAAARADAALTAEARALRLSLLQGARDAAAAAAEEADRGWPSYAERFGVPDRDTVLAEYPARIAALSAAAERDRQALAALEAKAFEKVALFRRGLPRGMSAFPGILPMAQDNMSSYLARLHRLVVGMKALHQVRAAVDRLGHLPADQPPTPGARAETLAALDRARGFLAPLAQSETFAERRDALREQKTLLTEQIQQRDAALKPDRDALREAGAGKSRDIRDRVTAREREIAALADDLSALDAHQDRNDGQLASALAVQSLIASLDGARASLAGGARPAGALRAELDGLLPAFASLDISLQRTFMGEIPWRHWARPLGRWALLIGLTYLVFLSLNVLIFRQWAHNEMITYPLAELPKALIGGTGAPGWIPALYQNGIFWAGVALSGGVMGWNLLCASQVVPGLTPLQLDTSWFPYVFNTQFEALGGVKSCIFFVMIGLAFLIPKNISFSLWFFHVVYLVQLLLISWAGHSTSYSYNWWYLMNFRLAEGQGALIVFSAVVLYKCRQFVFCALAPASVAGLESGERRELRLASWAFLGGSLAIILQLWLDMGANLFYTVFFYLMVILFTVGMIRAVTEGGLLAVKTHISPFHVVRAFLGLDQKHSVVTLFAPLVLYCGIVFIDIKVFIAPAMANALKLREDFRLRRWSFHLLLVLAIGAATLAATFTVMLLAYSRGADTLSTWFYTGFPRSALFGTLRNMVVDAPAASPSGRLWLGVGALGMGLLLFLRQYCFWLPHPLGLAMFVNPIMFNYWFSILLGWLANVFITKYGSPDAYRRARGFFIGLIVGEILIVILATLVSAATGANMQGIDLNKV